MLDEDLMDRINAFNALVGGNRILIPITLLSNAIVNLVEPGDGDYIKAYADLVNPFELECVIAKHRVWRGFDTGKTHAFEKDPKYLLQAGSVMVVRTDTLDTLAIEKLRQFENQGIGNETKDGYGAVRVAHINHTKYALV
jgi:hypothetical protein